MDCDIITILGPTASGKTALAAALAARLGRAEVISADSRQLYRGMDLGTGKDLDDYTVDGARVPYHLIDVAEAGERLNLFRYQTLFRAAYEDIRARGAFPVLCGGTGLYIEAALKGYRMTPVPENPELRRRLEGLALPELARVLERYKALHNTTDTDTRERAVRAIEIQEHYRRHGSADATCRPPRSLTLGLALPRDERRRRISERLRSRLDAGMVDEVRRLLLRLRPEDLLYYGLEYKYVTLYLTGAMGYGEMTGRLETAIHQFAKRQMTWFRGMERRGTPIHWVDALLPMEEKVGRVLSLLRGGDGAAASADV